MLCPSGPRLFYTLTGHLRWFVGQRPFNSDSDGRSITSDRFDTSSGNVRDGPVSGSPDTVMRRWQFLASGTVAQSFFALTVFSEVVLIVFAVSLNYVYFR